MRFYDILLFILLMNVSMSIVHNMGILENVGPSEIAIGGTDYTSYAKQQSGNLTSKVRSVTGTEAAEGIDLGFFNRAFHLLMLIIPLVLKIVLDSTVLVWQMFSEMGVPLTLNVALTAIIWISELLGLAQLISGRSFKEAE